MGDVLCGLSRLFNRRTPRFGKPRCMTAPILNIDALDFQPWGHGVSIPGAGHASDRYQARIAFAGRHLGAKKLGYNVTVLPPGKSAFPFHCHSVNEELFFVIEGQGELRFGDARHAIRVGDLIACPAGGAETAHQIINTSEADLKFLAVSTRLSPEVCEYPDTGRFGLLAEMPAAADGKPRQLTFVGRAGESLEYWQGE
jgi:uncharacterized cupin superfamily protein